MVKINENHWWLSEGCKEDGLWFPSPFIYKKVILSSPVIAVVAVAEFAICGRVLQHRVISGSFPGLCF
jgi:hypothetical protein